MVDNWVERKRPKRLERRVEFDNYDLTREFLDLTAEISEREGYYPDMNFGRNHVSITIAVNEGEEEFDESQLRFAREVNVLAPTDKIESPISADYTVEKKD